MEPLFPITNLPTASEAEACLHELDIAARADGLCAWLFNYVEERLLVREDGENKKRVRLKDKSIELVHGLISQADKGRLLEKHVYGTQVVIAAYFKAAMPALPTADSKTNWEILREPQAWQAFCNEVTTWVAGAGHRASYLGRAGIVLVNGDSGKTTDHQLHITIREDGLLLPHPTTVLARRGADATFCAGFELARRFVNAKVLARQGANATVCAGFELASCFVNANRGFTWSVSRSTNGDLGDQELADNSHSLAASSALASALGIPSQIPENAFHIGGLSVSSNGLVQPKPLELKARNPKVDHVLGLTSNATPVVIAGEGGLQDYAHNPRVKAYTTEAWSQALMPSELVQVIIRRPPTPLLDGIHCALLVVAGWLTSLSPSPSGLEDEPRGSTHFPLLPIAQQAYTQGLAAVVEAYAWLGQQVGQLCYRPAAFDMPLLARFEYDQDDLTSAEQERIDVWFAALRALGCRSINIDAHCDEFGSDAYNEQLSIRRASRIASRASLAGLLVAQLKGHGKSRPIALGNSDEAGRLNRRAEIQPLWPENDIAD